MKCCICGKEFEGYGNNPEGAAWRNSNEEVTNPNFTEEDRCCDDCNLSYVITGRLYRLTHNPKYLNVIEKDD